jgi:hypothetical protein
MRGRDWLASLGGGVPDPPRPEWLDVLIWAQEQHPGRGEASKWLAAEMGVDVRSAQRWLKLDAQPTRTRELRHRAEQLRDRLHAEQRKASAADRRDFVADLLAAMTTLTPGRVSVASKSSGRPQGTRDIGRLDNMAAGLAGVAEAWRDDDPDEAEARLSDAILSRYGGGDSDDTQGLAALLYVTDYHDGIRYT